MKNKRFRYVCLLASVCLFLTSGCGLFSREQEAAVDDTKQEDTETVPMPNVETEGEQSEDKLEETAPLDEEEQVILPQTAEEQKKQQSQKNQTGTKPAPVTETKPFWQSENTMQVNNLKSVATAAKNNYNALGEKLGWISKNGKLYAYYAGSYITTDTLVANGYLEKGLSSSSYDILLIRGSDLAAYEGASVPQENMGLTIFAAMKQSDGQYLIASSSGKAGLISATDYNRLLNSYNQNHGTISRLSSSSSEYGQLLGFIGLYEGQLEEYFVREIRKDGKYAVVTFSGKSNTANIKQHVLRNDNNFWEVVYPNVQNEIYPVYSINRVLPDFDPKLLTDYNVASWKAYMSSNQTGAVNAMFTNNYIKDNSQIYYQCGTSSYVYFVLQNGARYVAYREYDLWRVIHVASDYEAKNFIAERTGQDYGFIILDD
ncbi:hypothetical protein H9X85_08805 [Anaerotignum lactatifermentans]|uniref:Uncharacterized protein n=1 Tax=Anaerotignum lactatifermentans TaxID=160404 RepID=A0ABS2GBQ8_9FIRM|nr:hypothetical protein [Anaerotignum lactatifermentans]MBM6829837.1 hypothetical protein [Anaerotignum lactatifermentans]MBM6878223.1 hypothetical protein [Anaerotignum lactatifermentans]MBM6951303.1 hypothetical protein [Anaerotignum lactatifermentans]